MQSISALNTILYFHHWERLILTSKAIDTIAPMCGNHPLPRSMQKDETR